MIADDTAGRVRNLTAVLEVVAPAIGADLRTVLDEREQLAARVAELKTERDEDTRAVLAILNGHHASIGVALSALNARFESRLIELDQRDSADTAREAENG